MVFACQACLAIVTDASDGYFNNSMKCHDPVSIRDKFVDSFAEFSALIPQNMVLCYICVGILSVTYQFRQTCLETGRRIKSYMDVMPAGSKTDIGTIAEYYNRLQMIHEEKPMPKPKNVVVSNIKNKRNKLAIPHPFQCVVCLKRFTLSSALVQHSKKHALPNTHTVIQPSSCPAKNIEVTNLSRIKVENEILQYADDSLDDFKDETVLITSDSSIKPGTTSTPLVIRKEKISLDSRQNISVPSDSITTEARLNDSIDTILQPVSGFLLNNSYTHQETTCKFNMLVQEPGMPNCDFDYVFEESRSNFNIDVNAYRPKKRKRRIRKVECSICNLSTSNLNRHLKRAHQIITPANTNNVSKQKVQSLIRNGGQKAIQAIKSYVKQTAI